MLDMVQWGIIGSGNVVKRKSGGAFNIVKESSIYAVCGRDEQKTKSAAALFNAPCWYTSISELLSDDRVSAIYIASPPGLHLEHALACCEANKPVYIEKPLARCTKEARIIVEAFEQKNLPLYVSHYSRTLDKFCFVKKTVEDKIIGNIILIDFFLQRQFEPLAWHYEPKISGGGRFFDIAPHSLDLIQYFFGEIIESYGFACNFNKSCKVEDVVAIAFKTAYGAIGTAKYNLFSDIKDDKMTLWGTKGKLEFSVHRDTGVTVASSEGVNTYNFNMPLWEEQPMIQEVVNALHNKISAAVTGRDALNTMEVMDKALEGYYHGRNDDFWERPDSWG